MHHFSPTTLIISHILKIKIMDLKYFCHYRFAKFMEGECHLSENESFEHDTELTQLIEECDYTDDEFED